MIVFLMVTILTVMYLLASSSYKKTDYFKQTKKTLLTVWFDKGCYGEYLTYKYLREYETDGAKFLYNCYLPRDKGRTTEVDVMMIHSSGIYVFESKNYSGWIFGSENQKTWTQSLPNGRKSRKEHFLNPIMQNKLHIKWLKNQIGDKLPIHSVVVFSERCELKRINLNSSNIFVIKRNHLLRTVKAIEAEMGVTIQLQTVEEIYRKLQPYTQVTEAIKQKHIEDIKAEQAEVNTVENEERIAPGHKLVTNEVSNTSVESLVCPKCGGELVLRKSERGAYAGNHFYGCRNYPKCRYIKNL